MSLLLNTEISIEKAFFFCFKSKLSVDLTVLEKDIELCHYHKRLVEL